jgi:hypothetical protein
MNFSRLGRGEYLAVLGGLALALSLFLPWYETNPDNRNAVIDGVRGTVTAWEAFPILRWALLLLALAPLILAYILVRGHKLSYPPGEMTMISGFAGAVLIFYNGVIDKPGTGPAEIGLGLDWGYWLALVCAIVIAIVGFTRSVESGPKKTRKAPGTV